jgi:predicted PolB exonuclease-like 3'-5' exonuclease
MSVEWEIAIFLLLAAIFGMLIAICFKLGDLYVIIGRMNQEHQIERKHDEETFEGIKKAIPNRVEMRGDTYKMYHK